MSWNYRIVHYADGNGYGLHEVHYDENGSAISMTEQPASFVGDDSEEIIRAMLQARVDAKHRPIFVEPSEWMTASVGNAKSQLSQCHKKLARIKDILDSSLKHIGEDCDEDYQGCRDALVDAMQEAIITISEENNDRT